MKTPADSSWDWTRSEDAVREADGEARYFGAQRRLEFSPAFQRRECRANMIVVASATIERVVNHRYATAVKAYA
jgi:hypothetical protein